MIDYDLHSCELWKLYMASLGITDNAQVRFWIKGMGRSVEILRFCHGQCLYDVSA